MCGWAESSSIVRYEHLMLKVEKAKSRDKSILFKDMERIVKLIGFLIAENIGYLWGTGKLEWEQGDAIFHLKTCRVHVDMCICNSDKNKRNSTKETNNSNSFAVMTNNNDKSF